MLIGSLVLTACGASSTGSPPRGPTRSSTEPSLARTPVPAETATASPMPTRRPSGSGVLTVEGFAEVVADRLQVREAPGLSADVVEMPCIGCPVASGGIPMVIGRDGLPQLTSVYLLDGPVQADGYAWYLVAEDLAIPEPEVLGWVAAGDLEDPWLVPRDVTCPEEPIELADVTFKANRPLVLLYCLGGRELTLRGYYVVWAAVFRELWVEEVPWADSTDYLTFELAPGMGSMPEDWRWIEVTGEFDHPSAAKCGDGTPGSDLRCRIAFTVTSAQDPSERSPHP